MTSASGPTLVVGEAVIDIVVGASGREEHVGGSPANVAVGLARLGHPTGLLTHLARDPRGGRIIAHLAEAGVTLAVGSDTADRTATATAHVDAAGVATYEFDLPWDIPAVGHEGAGHVHTGSVAATLEPGASRVLGLVQEARPEATISYDPNLRPSIMGSPHEVRARVEELIGWSDVVKASDEDIAWLYAGTPVAEVARLWGRLGPSVVVVTQGPDGALVLLPATGWETVVPAQPATVVDTVGAGDSFMAGLLSGLRDARLIGGAAARERLRAAGPDDVLPVVHRAGACAHWTIERAGAAAPTRSDLARPPEGTPSHPRR